MNRIVNTNFTGEQLDQMRGMTMLHAEEKQITQDLFERMVLGDLIDDTFNSEDLSVFLNALVEIRLGFDSNEKSAEFLDKIDSTFVYHKNVDEMSPREIMCLFLNSICSWTYIYQTSIEDDGKIYKVGELYKQFKDFVNDNLGFSKRKMIKYPEFKDHLRKHALVKTSGTMFDTVKLTAESVCGLPQKKKF